MALEADNKPTEFVSARLSKALTRRIDALAKADDRSRSNQIKLLLEAAVPAEEQRRKGNQ